MRVLDRQGGHVGEKRGQTDVILVKRTPPGVRVHLQYADNLILPLQRDSERREEWRTGVVAGRLPFPFRVIRDKHWLARLEYFASHAFAGSQDSAIVDLHEANADGLFQHTPFRIPEENLASIYPHEFDCPLDDRPQKFWKPGRQRPVRDVCLVLAFCNQGVRLRFHGGGTRPWRTA